MPKGAIRGPFHSLEPEGAHPDDHREADRGPSAAAGRQRAPVRSRAGACRRHRADRSSTRTRATRIPPFIARRSDGQMIQMPELLYLVAEQIDGKRDYGAISEAVSEKLGRGVSPENIQTLVEEKLWPLGILAGPGGERPGVKKLDPLLALKLRTAVVPKSFTRVLTTLFYPLFLPAGHRRGARGDCGRRHLVLLLPRRRTTAARARLQPRPDVDGPRARRDRDGAARVGHEPRRATAARSQGTWAAASTSSGRPSTPTSPTRTGSAAAGGCAPTSAACTSTGCSS